MREIHALLDGARIVRGPLEGVLNLRYDGPLRQLMALRTVVAVHAVETFSGTRPSALLGDEQFRRLVHVIEHVRPSLRGARTLRLNAAGAGTPVMARLAAALSRALCIRPTHGAPDVLVRVRRPPEGAPGWQVLIRLGRRPLTARSWRVSDMPGALDASIAAVMVELTNPLPAHRFLNVACGSGTLCVERLLRSPAAAAVGVDISRDALACATANLHAARLPASVSLVRADAARLPLASGTVDEIVSDLPFGMVVGSPLDNRRLYPAFLAEASRVAAPGATLVVLTTSQRLFEGAMRNAMHWTLVRRVPVRVATRAGAIRPCIYVLRRPV